MDTRITDLTALTTPVSGDLFPIVDVLDTSMATSGTDKKITFTNLALAVVATIPTVFARAHPSSSQSIPSATETKILLATEDYDTNNNFASSRFTATVAGYYQVNGVVYYLTAEAGFFFQLYFKKNGSGFAAAAAQGTTGQDLAPSLSDIVFLTVGDYIEMYTYQNTAGSKSISASTVETFMSIAKL